MTKKAWWWLAAFSAIILSLGVSWANRYNINDKLVLNSYTPPAHIVNLANSSGMNEYGKRLFYVGQPKITGGEEFNNNCRDYEETKVLGCIVSGGQVGFSFFDGAKYQIYVLNVTEEELAGIQEVTAAHEMLHAAYSRLSATEKKAIDEEIVKVFNNVKTDKLKSIADSYAKQDASIVNNELHSLLGTEVSNVGPVLEKYYSKYFDDRSRVVALYEKYESVFEAAKNEAETIYGSIKLLESQILSKREELDSKAAELERSKAQLEALKAANDIASYNRQVPIYNQSVEEYNRQVAEIRALFNEYNDLIATYDNLVVKQQQLVEAIDSNVIPAPKL